MTVVLYLFGMLLLSSGCIFVPLLSWRITLFHPNINFYILKPPHSETVISLFFGWQQLKAMIALSCCHRKRRLDLFQGNDLISEITCIRKVMKTCAKSRESCQGLRSNTIFLWIIFMQIILYVWSCPTPENESPTQCILQEILSYPSEDALIM